MRLPRGSCALLLCLLLGASIAQAYGAQRAEIQMALPLPTALGTINYMYQSPSSAQTARAPVRD